MVTIQYYENNTLFFSQLVSNIPAIDEDIRIKGKKAKVVRIDQINESLIHIHIIFEKIKKKSSLYAKELNKKRR